MEGLLLPCHQPFRGRLPVCPCVCRGGLGEVRGIGQESAFYTHALHLGPLTPIFLLPLGEFKFEENRDSFSYWVHLKAIEYEWAVLGMISGACFSFYLA